MVDSIKFTATARRLGIFSATATIILLVAYAVTLAMGLASLESPQQPIGDPMFTFLGLLITPMRRAMSALVDRGLLGPPMPAKPLAPPPFFFLGSLRGQK